jgi:hypothetical protein
VWSYDQPPRRSRSGNPARLPPQVAADPGSADPMFPQCHCMRATMPEPGRRQVPILAVTGPWFHTPCGSATRRRLDHVRVSAGELVQEQLPLAAVEGLEARLDGQSGPAPVGDVPNKPATPNRAVRIDGRAGAEPGDTRRPTRIAAERPSPGTRRGWSPAALLGLPGHGVGAWICGYRITSGGCQRQQDAVNRLGGAVPCERRSRAARPRG